MVTGDWKMGGSIAGIEVITKILFYYFHERIWSKIKWDKNNGGGYLGFSAIKSPNLQRLFVRLKQLRRYIE